MSSSKVEVSGRQCRRGCRWGCLRRARLVWVALGVAGLLVSGCGSGGSDGSDRGREEAERTGVSATAAGSGSVGSQPAPSVETSTSGPRSNLGQAWAKPAFPARARERSSAGAEVFARYYLRLGIYAINEGRPGELVARSTPGCVGCRALARRLREINRYDGAMRHGGIRVLRVVELAESTAKRRVFEIELRQGSWQLVNSKGVVVDRAEAGRVTQEMDVVWRRGEWRVARQDVLS